MPAVRVVMDGLSNRHGGGKRYVESLLSAMVPLAAAGEIELLVALPDAGNAVHVPQGPGISSRVVAGIDSLASRLRWIQFGLPRLARDGGAHVIFAPGNIGPLRPKLPFVMTLQVTPEAAPLARHGWQSRVWWRSMTEASRLTALRADRIITGTNYLREWIVDHWGLAPEKIIVIPYGVSAPFTDEPRAFSRAAGTNRPFLLCVGDFQSHKNLLRLVDAFKAISAEFSSLDLILAGDKTGSTLPLVEDCVTKYRLQNRVRIIGAISTTELAALYRRAELVVMPSLAESFGLPLLEAMACGAAVAASGIAPFREIAGPTAAFFNGHSTDDMAATMRRLLSDTSARASLAQQARARARSFTWARTARDTVRTLHAAGGLVLPTPTERSVI